MFYLTEVNLLHVLVVTIVSFIIGFLWYGPVFGKKWMRLMNMTHGDMKSMKMKPAVAMLLGFVSSFVTAFVLAQFINLFNADNLVSGLKLSFLVWLGFIATITLGSFLWEGKSFNLWLFNNAYNLINFLVMGAILAVW